MDPYGMQQGPNQQFAMNGGQPQQPGQIDPALIQQVLALNSQGGQQAQIQRQLQMAQALRAQGLKGQQQATYGNGNVAAPNWAGAIANVLAARKAGQMETKADADTQQLSTDRQDALKRYFQALSSRGQQSSPMSGAGASGFGMTSGDY